MVKQSSPQLRVQYSMRTLREDSTSMPSPRGMPTELTAFAGDRDVLLPGGVDAGPEGHHLDAFIPREHRRAVVLHFAAEMKFRARFEV
jgi:hypothetical protein